LEACRFQPRCDPRTRDRLGAFWFTQNQEQQARHTHEHARSRGIHGATNDTETEAEKLVFASRNGTPINPKNLLRRLLQPACRKLNLPVISWHSFRHTPATLLGEVGESLRTAQAILGHSDLETTLNIYSHPIPESQPRAVERVAELLDPNGLKNRGIYSESDRQLIEKWSTYGERPVLVFCAVEPRAGLEPATCRLVREVHVVGSLGFVVRPTP
jgi:integrase-like protein